MNGFTEAGQVLSERYRLVSPYPDQLRYPEVAVWNAVDTLLGTSLRLIALNPTSPTTGEALDAARRSSLIDDPHVVRILSVGEDPVASYVATEIPLGTPLSHFLGGVPFPPNQAHALIGEIASALNSARSRGVRHLQLSPQQVRVGILGEVFIDGLGVDAALAGLHPDSVKTAEADRMETRGLTVLLAQLLTGQPVGDEASLLQAAASNPALPEQLRNVCARELNDVGALSPGEFVRELAPWGAVAPGEFPDPGQAPVAQDAMPAVSPSQPAPGAPGDQGVGPAGAAAAASGEVDPLSSQAVVPSGMTPRWANLDAFAEEHPEAVDPAATAIFKIEDDEEPQPVPYWDSSSASPEENYRPVTVDSFRAPQDAPADHDVEGPGDVPAAASQPEDFDDPDATRYAIPAVGAQAPAEPQVPAADPQTPAADSQVPVADSQAPADPVRPRATAQKPVVRMGFLAAAGAAEGSGGLGDAAGVTQGAGAAPQTADQDAGAQAGVAVTEPGTPQPGAQQPGADGMVPPEASTDGPATTVLDPASTNVIDPVAPASVPPAQPGAALPAGAQAGLASGAPSSDATEAFGQPLVSGGPSATQALPTPDVYEEDLPTRTIPARAFGPDPRGPEATGPAAAGPAAATATSAPQSKSRYNPALYQSTGERLVDEEGNKLYNPSKFVVLAAVALVVAASLWSFLTFFAPIDIKASPAQNPASASAPATNQQPQQPVQTADDADDLASPEIESVNLLNPQAAALDPSNIDEQDSPGMVKNLIDGSSSTNWQSWWYSNENFVGKQGIGLEIKLKENSKVSSIELASELEGGNVQWVASDAAAPNAGDVIAESPMSSTTQLSASQPVATDTVILWFNKLPPDGKGNYRIDLTEVTVK
ncbi:MAG: hypothetical protein Q3979_03115 [Actinomycetaceae bacterium]|nr:hypothetical protein [Actinomycetaceae bacterium]